ncbi:MAG TPA: 50S ribosomal protein L25 [Candidatus Paceibacterota bacterium]|nr:50S ribosomal protein L25 [Candidatus Paceibacterota bacterium]HMP19073.1 50S ribosomal protein L25 [Candidatus Paceibacterota bacterium]HMP85423.1 50S ribosomal protein L25 [Candidatus Paceibacterota bacterium]
MIELKAEKRESSENNINLRKSGFVPAVFYGPKEKSTPIKIKLGDFIKAYESAGESSIIDLKEGSDEHECLIHDVQFDAVSGQPIHADFYVIEKGKKIEVSIPLNFIGESPAEKTLGGVLVKVMHSLNIKAMPKDLPNHIDVDISSLVDFESKIKTGDIKLSNGVELDIDENEVIALVQAPREEKDEAPQPIDLESIEVEAKGKKEEDTADSQSSEK